MLANILVAIVFFLMGTVRETTLFLVAAGLAGAAWTMAASELWVAGQRAMPSWARGRMNATIIMAAQGAMALGGIVWGSSVSVWGVQPTLIVACLLQLASLVIQFRLSIDFTSTLDFEPGPVAGSSHKLIHIPAPHDGPVAIMIDVEIDRTRGLGMIDVLREVRLIHLTKRRLQLATARRSRPAEQLPDGNVVPILDRVSVDAGTFDQERAGDD